MGNDLQSKAIGISTVELRMLDGTTVTLTDVQHVRDLTKSPISLGTLEEKYFKYSIEDGVLIVTKDGYLVMSARRSGNLYIL